MAKHKLIIEVREDDNVYVTGPLHDKNLCNAMIEEAKDVVNKWKKPIISTPTINDLKKLNGTTSVQGGK